MEAKKRRWEDDGAPEIAVEDARKMIEPLTREQLMDILQQATVNHYDVLEEVRKVVDRDSSQRKLFVRGLGYETTMDSLKSVFAQHGEVEDVVVVVDKATGKNKGYGFVTFKHVDGALSALKDPSKKVDGRMTVSNLASQGASQQQNLLQQQLQQQLQYQQLMMQSVQVVQPVQPVQPVQHVQPVQPVQHVQSIQPVQPVQHIQPVQHVQPVQQVQPVLAQLPSADVVLRKIYVGNVPTDMTAARLLSFFSQFGEVEEGPLGYDKQTGKSKGFALIVFKTVEAAKKALEDPVKSIDGQQLFCKLALEGQKQKALANQGQPVSVSSDGGYANPASMNPGIQYSALGHGLVNSALGVNQSAANPTALAHQGLSPYALSDAALAGLPSHNPGLPSATSLSHNSSLNLSTPSSLGRDLLLQGISSVPSAARTSLGAGSYGIGSYGSSGYVGLGGAASLYGIPSSSSVSQTAAYQGASHYGLSSYQSQQTGASSASRISAAAFLQGLPPF